MANGPLARGGRAQSDVDGLVWVDGVLHVRTTTCWLDEAGDELTFPRADTRADTDDDGRGRARLTVREQASGTVRELPTRSTVEVVARPGDRVAVRVRAEARLYPRTVTPDAGPGTWVVLAELPGAQGPHPVEMAREIPGRPAVVGAVAYHAYRDEGGALSVDVDARADRLVGASRLRTAEAALRTAPDDDSRRTVRLTVPLDGIRVFPTDGRRVVAHGAAELGTAPGTGVGRTLLRGRGSTTGPTTPGTFRLVAEGEDVELQVTLPATPGRWRVVLTSRPGVHGAVPLLVHVRRHRRARLLAAGTTQAATGRPEPPRVSVVVPVHNGEDTIEEAVRSVFAQTLPAEQIEIIAVDDGSTDDSLAILRRLESGRPGMRVFTQPASGTAAAPRNKGIEAATGRHLFFLDADDLLTRTALEKMTEAADALDADVVLGKMGGFAGRTNVPNVVFKHPSVDADMVENAMMRALGPTKLFRTSHVKGRGLRFPAGLRHGEDQAFVAEAELTARRILILTDAVYYRVRGHEPVPGARGRAAIDIRLLKARLVAGVVERHTEPGERRDALLPRPFGDRALEGVFRRVYLALDPEEQAELVDQVVDEFGHLWTPGLRARVHPHARPLYDLVFRRDPANVAALVRHAGGNVRLLPVVVDRDGFCLDVPAGVAEALGRDAFAVPAPRVEHRLTRLTTSDGHVAARGRMHLPTAGALPDGVHAEWRPRGPSGPGGVPMVPADATVLRTVKESPQQEAVVFSVDTEVAALPATGLWELWVAPVWNGWTGAATRFGGGRDASVDPDAVVVDGSPSVLHSTAGSGTLADRDGAHHQVPTVRLTALRTDADGRPEAVLRVPSLVPTTRVYADVGVEESRDARHRLPWSRVDDEHLAARLPVPFTTTTLPLTLAVSSEGVRTPVVGDAPLATETPELRAESTPGAPDRPAARGSAAQVQVTRTSPVPRPDGPDAGPLPAGGDPDEPIRLWWWRWRHPTELNFGDEVTAPVLERLTGRRVVWTPLARAEVVGAGSVLQLTLRRRKSAMPTVWGAGMIRPFKGEAPADFVPRAVRGRLSLDSLSPAARAGAVLGDPGILADRLVDGPVSTRYTLGVVPHYKDADDPTMRAIAALPGVRLIDVAWTPEEVAREVAACEVVVSSSMHGLIFADALGVPNARLKVSDKLVGGDFKFRDYCSAFGPDRYQPPLTPGDVRDLDLDQLVDLVRSRFRPPRGIDELRRGLIRVLPR